MRNNLRRKISLLIILIGIVPCYFTISYLKKKYVENGAYAVALANVPIATKSFSERYLEDKKIGSTSFYEVDFDQDMGISVYEDYKYYFEKPEGKKAYDLFKHIYNQNKPSKRINDASNSIPKIIHQIWPGKGGKNLPAKYVFYQNSIKDLHPNWRYVLWTEDLIQAENFPDIDLYNTTRTYAEKADIARYMILKKYGGLYLDMDTFCLKSFDNIINLYSFFAGIEPNNSVGFPHLINALIAAEPNHRIINKTLELIRHGWRGSEEKYEMGLLPGMDAYWLVRTRTFMPFDEAFKSMVTPDDEDIVAFPPTYFYPFYFGKKFFSEVRPYSVTYHDFEKVDSNIPQINFGHWARGLKLKNNAQKIRLENFKSVFEKKFPSNVAYKSINAIPNIIYINGSNAKDWQSYYSLAKVKEFDISRIINNDSLLYHETLQLAQDDNEKELLAVLVLLYNKGGVFINKDLYPVQHNINAYMQNLLELNNKYDFYGFIENKDSSIIVSNKLFAVAPKSYLIEKVLDEIKRRADGKVYEVFDNKVYKYLYLGNNILFPSIYFGENE